MKLGRPSRITTISPSRIALCPPTSGWISGYRYVMSYSPRTVPLQFEDVVLGVERLWLEDREHRVDLHVEEVRH
jgi:hypothetical protein